jgi:enamine deaminase RidA (YjgF/YER057c/UK114 family)
MREVEPLLPVTLKGGIRYAPGIRAGDWIFATGHKATTGYTGGIAAEVVSADLPQWNASKLRREADRIFGNVAKVIEAGGGAMDRVVRVDQNYTSGRAVEAYHDARRAVMKDHIPPSTSTLTGGFLLPDQQIEVHMIGAAKTNTAAAPRHIRPKDQDVHYTSGYSLALEYRDLVFVAGRMADSFTFGEGIAAEARVPDKHLWKGLPIKLEAEFIVKNKIEPALKAAGSSLEDAVKCQVYLRDPDDFAPFTEVWAKLFPRGTPATSLIPTADPGFFLSDAHIEINTIALKSGGTTRRQPIAASTTPAYRGFTEAVRAGDLLFISGLLPIDERGLVPEARIDPAQPWFGSSVQAQMAAMLDNAESICRAAGTTLSNVVRVQQYHTDLSQFHAAWQVWDERLPGQHLPFSAVKVPFLPVPGCTVQLDLWIYVP